MAQVRPLPQVPRTGRATEILPRILCTCPELRKDKKRKQIGPRSRGLPVRRTPGTKAKLVPSFAKVLIQEDRVANFEFPKTALAPGGDTGVHDVGLALKSFETSAEADKDVLASLFSLWEDSSFMLPEPSRARDSVSQVEPPGRSWRAQQAYCRSLMSSRGESRLNAKEEAEAAEGESSEALCASRLDDLQGSFSIGAEEAAAKLEELRRKPVGDYHIDMPEADEEESFSSKTPSSANLSFINEAPPPVPRRRRSSGSERSTPALKATGLRLPSLEELRELYAGAGLSLIPAKPQQPFMHSELPETKASHEELLRAVKRLNAIRWFCRLPPVHVEEEEVELCNFLSEALLMREPVFLAESHPLTRRFSDLGMQLGGFMAQGDHTLMLHKESSLISSIDVGILCSHTVGLSYASTPAPGVEETMPGLSGLPEVARAASHRERHAAAGAREWVPTLQRLPDSLAGYRSMWEILHAVEAAKLAEPMLTPRPLGPRPSESRSRPGTVGTISSSTSRQTQERRPNTTGGPPMTGRPNTRARPHSRGRPSTSGGRVRQVSWSSTETAKRREWSRATNLSWGDRSQTVVLRRQLLSPKLESLGAARRGQTCVLRLVSGEMTHEPDFVIFPPEGVCPMELLMGCRLPTWTIMPNSGRFQSSQCLQVRMWRVHLERPRRERRLHHNAPYGAQRLEELPLSFLTCDCSAEGNSFCIIFRPQLQRISDGDQFEVELSGLRGSHDRHHFFHEFLPCGELEWQDHEFLQGVQNFCQSAEQFCEDPPEGLGAQPELRPLSHFVKEFKTDETELSMYFQCLGALSLDACLRLQRSDGKITVERATMVVNLRDRFLVRVRLPCSVSKYELSFRTSTRLRPEKMVEQTLRYSIRTSESRSYPVPSVEDPPSEKYLRFGFCPVPAVAQLLGVSICAPLQHGLQPGRLYFLVHVQPQHLKCESAPEPLGSRLPTQLFHELQAQHQEAERMALESEAIVAPDPLFEDELATNERMQEMMMRRTFQNTQRMMLHRPSAAQMDPTVNVVRRLHHGLECHLAERIQDLPSRIQFDLVVRDRAGQERFALRLQQKLDHPEFFQGVMHLHDHDHDARVELFYRPLEARRAPLKIGAWTVTRWDSEE